MKKTILLLIILLLPAIASAFQNEPDGFRGIKWGTDINTLPDSFHALSTPKENEMINYINRDDSSSIGDAKIRSLQYGFYNNKLADIYISFHDLPDFINIKEVLFQQYGEGKKPYSFLYEYHWDGDQVLIRLNYNEITKDGYVNYSFIPLLEEQMKYMQEQGKKGAKDL